MRKELIFKKNITDARHKNYGKSCGTIINLQWDG